MPTSDFIWPLALKSTRIRIGHKKASGTIPSWWLQNIPSYKDFATPLGLLRWLALNCLHRAVWFTSLCTSFFILVQLYPSWLRGWNRFRVSCRSPSARVLGRYLKVLTRCASLISHHFRSPSGCLLSTRLRPPPGNRLKYLPRGKINTYLKPTVFKLLGTKQRMSALSGMEAN